MRGNLACQCNLAFWAFHVCVWRSLRLFQVCDLATGYWQYNRVWHIFCRPDALHHAMNIRKQFRGQESRGKVCHILTQSLRYWQQPVLDLVFLASWASANGINGISLSAACLFAGWVSGCGGPGWLPWNAGAATDQGKVACVGIIGYRRPYSIADSSR